MPNTQTRTILLTDITGDPLCIRVAQIDYVRMPKNFDGVVVQTNTKPGCVIHLSGMALPVQEKFEDVSKQIRWAKGDD